MMRPLFVFRLGKRFRAGDFVPTLLAAGLVLAVAGLLALVLMRADPPAPRVGGASGSAGKSVAAAPDSAPSQPSEKLSERMEAAATEELRRKAGADLSGEPVFEVPGPLRSIDGTTFKHGDAIVRIDGIEGPGAGAVCRDGEGRWSCGLQARAALHNLVGGRSLACQPRRSLSEGRITADCQLAARDSLPEGDVARLLVVQGWARGDGREAGAYAAETAMAQAAGAGLWRGGWNLQAR